MLSFSYILFLKKYDEIMEIKIEKEQYIFRFFVDNSKIVGQFINRKIQLFRACSMDTALTEQKMASKVDIKICPKKIKGLFLSQQHICYQWAKGYEWRVPNPSHLNAKKLLIKTVQQWLLD